MVIHTAQATASHPVFYWERQEYYSSILTLNLWKKKKSWQRYITMVKKLP